MNVVGSKWVYRLNATPTGPSIAITAVWSPKGSINNLALTSLIHLAQLSDTPLFAWCWTWPLCQLDVECAFLHGDLHDAIFMAQPQDYIDPTKPTHVCQIVKSNIYGIRQAPRA